MLFLFIVALASAMAVGSLMWKAMSRNRPEHTGWLRPNRAVAPDDDPEFLRQLGERRRSEGEDPPTRR
ncbi:MAG: hypothetical protein H0V92_01815 [Pseudonocardiales bacterium]|nr:hypothetical protein [Pseudonocardiales bacterium]